MKKSSKKLVLAKETMRELTRVQMGQVAGGTSDWTCLESTCRYELASGQSYYCG